MRWIAVIGAALLAASGSGQVSSFNGLPVLPADSTGHYRILIGGHFHGESTNRSGYPASTLLANLDTINSLGADLFLSTGDLFMDAASDRDRYERAFFSKLKVPLFNAPGNHDFGVPDGFGRSGILRFGFVAARVLLLNTELNDGALDNAQLEELRSLVDSDERDPPIFIISHRPIWSEDDPQYSDLFKDNTRSFTGTNFQKDVYPILQKIAKHAQVYWISGSLGGGAPSSIFIQEHAPNITFIQCAIRDEPRDALLIADVYPDSVHWSALSLTGQILEAPKTYDAAWWRKHTGRGEGFNWRLLPYMTKKTLTHAAFWWGAAFALFLVFLVRRLLRR